MPTYEYVCQACNHTFDELQSYSDELLKKCPACKKKKLKRSFGTGAAILFKGSGFYQTDYRSESYKSGAKAEENRAAPPKADGAASTGTTKTGDTAPASEPKTNGASKGTEKKPKTTS